MRLRPPEAESRLDVACRGSLAPVTGIDGFIEKIQAIRRSLATSFNDKRLQSMADVDCNSGAGTIARACVHRSPQLLHGRRLQSIARSDAFSRFCERETQYEQPVPIM